MHRIASSRTPCRIIALLFLLGLCAGCPQSPLVTPAAPLALFSVTPSTGLAPLVVTFADESVEGTSPITYRLWDFGDGSSGQDQNPVHTYTKPGTYAVTLSVASVVGVNRLSKDGLVTVRSKSPPRANFTADVVAGETPLLVSFTDTSDSGTSDITAWHWDFGDGAISSIQNPTHTYTKLGRFEVSLTATSVVGVNTATKGAFITVSGMDLTFGASGVDRAFGLTALDDGRYVLVGDTTDASGASRDLDMITTDVYGNLATEQRFTGTGDETATGIVPTNDGGLFISGTKTAADGSTQALLIRTDTGGSRLWSKYFGNPASESAAVVVRTIDDGALIAGSSLEDEAVVSQAWAARIDADGGLVWSLTFGDGRFTSAIARGSGFVLCGATVGDEDARAVRTDGDGNIAWDVSTGGDGKQVANGIAVLPNGGYVLAGAQIPAENSSRAWLISLDPLGAPGWELTYPSEGPSRANAVVVRPDGRIIFAGSAKTSASTLDDALLVSLSPSGNVQWEHRFGGAKSDRAYALVAETDGGYVLAGTTESFGILGTNIYFVKTNASGVQQRFPVPGRD